MNGPPMTALRRVRRPALAALVIGALAAATACSAGSGPNLPERPAETTAAAAAPGQPPTCSNDADTVASYQPQGALPAPGTFAAGSTMAAIKKRGRLRVAVSADTLLFSFRNPQNGQIQGFDVDMADTVAKAIFGDTDNRLEFKIVNYGQRIPALQDKSVDLVADVMTINCTRWKQIAFSTVYYQAGQKILVASDSRADSIDYFTTHPDRVCVATGSTNIDELKSKYPKVMRTEVGDVSDCMVLFQQGKVAAVTGDDTVLAGFAAQDPYATIVGRPFTSEPYGLGMRSDQTDLVRFVNAVLAKDRADGGWAARYRTWLKPADGKAPAPPVARYGRQQQ